MAKLPTQVEIDVATLTAAFTATGNPAAAWAVFHLARKHNLPMPDAVAVEIDRFAAEVATPALAAWGGDARAALSASDVTSAFGIGRGRFLARDLRLFQRDSDIMADYLGHMRDGTADHVAVKALGEKYGLGEKVPRDILAAFRKANGPTYPSLFDGSSTDGPA